MLVFPLLGEGTCTLKSKKLGPFPPSFSPSLQESFTELLGQKPGIGRQASYRPCSPGSGILVNTVNQVMRLWCEDCYHGGNLGVLWKFRG